MGGLRWPWLNEDMDLSAMTKWRPSVDITEEDKEFLIKVEVPEVKKEDLKVEMENGMLTVRTPRGNKGQKTPPHGAFLRQFRTLVHPAGQCSRGQCQGQNEGWHAVRPPGKS